MERLWGTLQHRLVVDMRLAGIASIEEANAFLATYPDKHNEGFTVEPERKASLKDTAKKIEKDAKEKTPVKPAPDHPWRREEVVRQQAKPKGTDSPSYNGSEGGMTFSLSVDTT